MLRISGGIFRGRLLKSPPGRVRPTKEMVREALFSALGPTIQDRRVVDLYAGSGAVGLEALSRGAADVLWVESDPRVYAQLRATVDAFSKQTPVRLRCVKHDVLSWLKLKEAGDYDLIFADPPYRPPGEDPWGTILLPLVSASGKLKPGGLFVLEQHADQPVIDNPEVVMVKDARYGESRLVYYRNRIPEGGQEEDLS